jgi:hypothetical protein
MAATLSERAAAATVVNKVTRIEKSPCHIADSEEPVIVG